MKYLELKSEPATGLFIDWAAFCSLLGLNCGYQVSWQETCRTITIDNCFRYQFARAGDFVVWRAKRRSFARASSRDQWAGWGQWHDWCFLRLPAKEHLPFVRMLRDLSWQNRIKLLSCMGALHFNPEAPIAVCKVKKA